MGQLCTKCAPTTDIPQAPKRRLPQRVTTTNPASNGEAPAAFLSRDQPRQSDASVDRTSPQDNCSTSRRAQQHTAACQQRPDASATRPFSPEVIRPLHPADLSSISFADDREMSNAMLPGAFDLSSSARVDDIVSPLAAPSPTCIKTPTAPSNPLGKPRHASAHEITRAASSPVMQRSPALSGKALPSPRSVIVSPSRASTALTAVSAGSSPPQRYPQQSSSFPQTFRASFTRHSSVASSSSRMQRNGFSFSSAASHSTSSRVHFLDFALLANTTSASWEDTAVLPPSMFDLLPPNATTITTPQKQTGIHASSGTATVASRVNNPAVPLVSPVGSDDSAAKSLLEQSQRSNLSAMENKMFLSDDAEDEVVPLDDDDEAFPSAAMCRMPPSVPQHNDSFLCNGSGVRQELAAQMSILLLGGKSACVSSVVMSSPVASIGGAVASHDSDASVDVAAGVPSPQSALSRSQTVCSSSCVSAKGTATSSVMRVPLVDSTCRYRDQIARPRPV